MLLEREGESEEDGDDFYLVSDEEKLLTTPCLSLSPSLCLRALGVVCPSLTAPSSTGVSIWLKAGRTVKCFLSGRPYSSEEAGGFPWHV